MNEPKAVERKVDTILSAIRKRLRLADGSGIGPPGRPALAWLFDHVTPATSLLGIALGTMALLGWGLDPTGSKGAIRSSTPMGSGVALGVIFSGLGLWCVYPGNRPLWIRRVGQASAVLVMVLGLSTFGEYLRGAPFLAEVPAGPPGLFLGRMAATTAIGMIAFAASVLLLGRGLDTHGRMIQVLAMLPILQASASGSSFLFGQDGFSMGMIPSMSGALHTSLVMGMLALGVVNARPEYLLRRAMTSNSLPDSSARLLLLLMSGVFVLAGWVLLQGHHAGRIHEAQGVALIGSTCLSGLVILVLWDAKKLVKANSVSERALDDLRTATRYARSLIEAGLDPLVTISVEGKITDANEATVKATGIPRPGLIGLDFFQCFTKPEEARKGYREAFEKGFITDYPLTLRHVSGKLMDVLYNASVYQDEYGEVAGVFAVARDISERRLAEEALVQSEDKFKYLFEHSPVGKSITSPDGEIQVNEAFCRMLGFHREELENRSWRDITHPDDLALTQRALDPILAGDEESSRFIKRYIHKSGAVIWADVSTSLRRDKVGRAMYFITSVNDITERKEAEDALLIAHERLRKLIDSNLIGIVIARASGAIVEANDYYLQLIGYSRAEFEQGAIDWRALTPPEWLPVDEQAISEMQVRGICSPYEKEYLRRDGSRVSVLLADTMLPGPEEQIAAFALDITDRKLAEKEIRSLNTYLEQRVAERTLELESANQELEAFAYSVSHDLRAPLRAIDGFSRKVVASYGESLDQEGRRQLQVVRDNAQRMGRLIDDLLAFSRLGRRELAMQWVDMETLARSVSAEVGAAEPERRIEFAVSALPRAWGDAAMLRQVWANLLGNAVKFSRQRQVAHIAAGGHAAGGETVYWVKDDGAGFDMRFADKLFGVFQRLHHQDEFEGTGVGLALTQRILHRHHGHIQGEGFLDTGATFTFALPLPSPDSSMPETPHALC